MCNYLINFPPKVAVDCDAAVPEQVPDDVKAQLRETASSFIAFAYNFIMPTAFAFLETVLASCC